jgi:hypothetical protein
MTEREKIYRKALERIARCNEQNLERYVAKVDAIAVDALVHADALDDHGLPHNTN